MRNLVKLKVILLAFIIITASTSYAADRILPQAKPKVDEETKIKTAKNLNIKLRTKKIDYLSFLNHNNEKFDIVFADPPYSFSLDNYLNIIDLIKKNEILKANGQLIIEHRSNISFINKSPGVEERNYGSNSLSFFKKASL